MGFSSNEFRPLAYNGIGLNQLVAYVSDIKSTAEGGSYPISIDATNTVGADSISVIYSSWNRVGNRGNVTLRLTFVPTQIDPVIAVHANLNVIPYADDTYAAGTGSLWLVTSPTALDGSVKVTSIASSTSVGIKMLTPDFDSIKSYELNVVNSYQIDPVSSLDSFITVWDTRTDDPMNAVIALPLVPSGTYDFIVDWGDLSFDHITAYNDAAVTHTYTEPGQYTVKIYGTLTGWSFSDITTSAANIIDVTQWGNVQICDLTTNGYFYGTTYLQNISALDAPALSSTMESMFENSSIVNIVSASLWDTSSINTMQYCFKNAANFNGQGVNEWDTTNVVNMIAMYQNATSVDQDFSAYNVGNLQFGDLMFDGVTLSTDNYNALLVGWSGQSVQTGITFSGGNSHYDGAGVAARAVLTGTYSWTITDGGTP